MNSKNKKQKIKVDFLHLDMQKSRPILKDKLFPAYFHLLTEPKAIKCPGFQLELVSSELLLYFTSNLPTEV